MEYDEENVKNYKLPEFESYLFRFLVKIFPWPFRMLMRHNMRMRMRPLESAHNFFAKSKRIDIVPLRSGQRGFMIIIDQNKALYFYQDGDSFRYDGCKMGDYEKGDVTLFDDLKY